MPKKFSTSEIEYLNNRILNKGKELFFKYGIKKTTVDDIVQSVGISKGSFYTFFKTKEHLFFEMYITETKNIEKEFISQLNKKNNIIKKNLKNFLRKKFSIDSKSAISLLYDKENFEYLNRKFPQKEIGNFIKDDFENLIDIIKQLEEKGVVSNYSSLQVAQMFHILFFLSLKKDELELHNRFDQDSIELMLDLILNAI